MCTQYFAFGILTRSMLILIAMCTCAPAIAFTALYGTQTRYSDEKDVRPFVRLFVRQSVKRVHCDKTEERSARNTVRKIIYPRFLLRRTVGERRHLLPEIRGQLVPVGAKSPKFEPIFLRSASDVTPSEKVQLTLIGSRAFQ